MPNQLTLTIGANTVTVPIKGSNAAVNAAILRYAIQTGLDVAGKTATEIGADVLKSLIKIVADRSLDRQRIDLLAAQQATIDATLLQDNDL